jgi:hypothetical protein
VPTPAARGVGVPEAVAYRPKWRVALDEIDRVLASGARFGCVLADAEYGKAAEFRAGLGERRLAYAVGVLPTQKVYPAEVTLSHPPPKATGRPRKHPVPSAASVARPSCSRRGRGRSGPSPGAPAPRARSRPRSPRSGCGWPTGRSRREASTCPAGRRGSSASAAPPASASTTWPTSRRQPARGLAALIKARWVCEQMHQQLKDELGLDHFEGPLVARAAPPRPAVPARLRLPAAPAARGEKGPTPRPGPAHHPGRACPPSGGASRRPSPAPCCAARIAGGASTITSGSELAG